eukprot:SAG22_NODE_115_length_19315_cov_10.458368_10_plen_82_part_00
MKMTAVSQRLTWAPGLQRARTCPQGSPWTMSRLGSVVLVQLGPSGVLQSVWAAPAGTSKHADQRARGRDNARAAGEIGQNL